MTMTVRVLRLLRVACLSRKHLHGPRYPLWLCRMGRSDRMTAAPTAEVVES